MESEQQSKSSQVNNDMIGEIEESENLIQIEPFDIDHTMIGELSKLTFDTKMEKVQNRPETKNPDTSNKKEEFEYNWRGQLIYSPFNYENEHFIPIEFIYCSNDNITFRAVDHEGNPCIIAITRRPRSYSKDEDQIQIDDIFGRSKKLQDITSNNITKCLTVFFNGLNEKQQHIAVVLEHIPYMFVDYFDCYNKHTTNLTIGNMLSIFIQLALCVYHMHSQGIAHRDIRLNSIGIKNNAHLCFVGFGFTRLDKGEDTRGNGCDVYRSPQFQKYLRGSEDVVVNLSKNDIWSLGIIFFVLISGGKHPLLNGWEEQQTIKDTDYSKRIYTPANKITADKVKTPYKDVAVLIANMLSIDQDLRYSIQEVCQILSHILTNLGEKRNDPIQYVE